MKILVQEKTIEDLDPLSWRFWASEYRVFIRSWSWWLATVKLSLRIPRDGPVYPLCVVEISPFTHVMAVLPPCNDQGQFPSSVRELLCDKVAASDLCLEWLLLCPPGEKFPLQKQETKIAQVELRAIVNEVIRTSTLRVLDPYFLVIGNRGPIQWPCCILQDNAPSSWKVIFKLVPQLCL